MQSDVDNRLYRDPGSAWGLRVVCISAALLLPILVVPVVGADRPTGSTVDAASVRAAAIGRVIQRVAWPEAAFLTPGSAFRVGVLGDGLDTGLLGTMVGDDVAGREVVIERFANIEALRPCHVLVFAADAGPPTKDALRLVAGLGVLTVSESPDFIDQGGMISVSIERDRLALGVNQVAVRREGIALDDRVVALAKRVIR